MNLQQHMIYNKDVAWSRELLLVLRVNSAMCYSFLFLIIFVACVQKVVWAIQPEAGMSEREAVGSHRRP